MEIFTQTLGWIGTFLIIFAYTLISYNKKINGSSKVYQLLTLLGSVGIGINVFYQHAWPALALQIFAILVSSSVLMREKKK